MPNYKPSVHRMGESLGRYYYSDKWVYAQFSTSLRGNRLYDAVHQVGRIRASVRLELETWYMVRRKHNKELRDLYNRILKPMQALESVNRMLHRTVVGSDRFSASTFNAKAAYGTIGVLRDDLWKYALIELFQLYPDLYKNQ